MIPDLLRRVAGNAVAGDPYYSAVSLLLHFNGANGSTTFTDSSSNNLTVTPFGNAQISTTQNKFGGASAAFDGNGDYLATSASNAMKFGTGDFTVEGWFYASSIGSNTALIEVTNASNVGLMMRQNTNNSLLIYNRNTATILITTANNSLVVNTWQHIAVVRYNGTLTVYINGTSAGSASSVTTSFDSTIMTIGGFYDGTSASPYGYNGYADEIRVTVGLARYTANFTAPSAPFPDRIGSIEADAYYPQTSLLLHMDGTNASTSFVDSGPNALAVTASGNAQISTAQSKFGGASGAFDGTGDYLTATNSSLFAFGTGDFTIEFWFRTNDTAGGFAYVSGGTTGYWQLSLYNSSIYWQTAVNTTNAIIYNASAYLDNNWHHLAIVRSSSTTKLYLDGSSVASASDSTNYSGTAGSLIIGRDSSNSDLQANIDELRITKSARYTSNFTPRAKAFPDIYNPYKTLPVSGAALWLDGADSSSLFTDAGVTPVKVNGDLVYQWSDKSGNSRHATQTTSANRPTWVPPASGRNGLGALAFNGSSQFISVPHSVDYGIGTNSFTIECWVKLTAALGSGGWTPIATKYSAGSLGTEDTFQFAIQNTSGTMQIALGLVSGSSETNLNFNLTGVDTQLNSVWNHVAVCRSGSSLRAFFNGVQVGTTQTYSSSINAGTLPLAIGARPSPYPVYFNGQIQNFLFYNNQALYTFNFTPWMS